MRAKFYTRRNNNSDREREFLIKKKRSVFGVFF